MRPRRARPGAGAVRARRARSRRWRQGRRSSKAQKRALDAVEAAVRVLEEDSCFNAGRGSVLTASGCIELDAAIMDGRDRARRRRLGPARRRARRSASRAGCSMRGRTCSCLATGADDFARDHGLEQVENSWFEIPERRAQLDELMSAGGFDDEVKYGTVGAVAVDVDGHVAVATSTGGLTAKRWGRVGDSPLIGAGTYADDRAAAVSATGSGEYFIRAVAAHQLAERVRIGGQSLAGGARCGARRYRVARRQGRTDRCRSRRRSGLGLHHACNVPRNGRCERPNRARLFGRRGAIGQVAPQPFDLGSHAFALRFEELGDRIAKAARSG